MVDFAPTPEPWPNDDALGEGLDIGPLLHISPEADVAVQAMVEAMRTPLAPGDPRRHHYIPQFYLRNFAKGSRIAKVWLDDPGRHKVSNVADVAVQKDLYTVQDPELGDTVAVERMLAGVDSEAAKAMPRLLAGVLFPPQYRDRMALAHWMSLLFVRGPDTRRWMEALTDQAMKLTMQGITDAEAARVRLRAWGDGAAPTEQEVQTLAELGEDLSSWEVFPHQNEMVREMLRLSLEALPCFLGRRWTLMKFAEPGLVLCDRPLVLNQRPENYSPTSGVGLGTADELWLPLDRSTALILHNDPKVGERVIRLHGFYTVDDFNQVVVYNARSEVYCHPDDLPRLDGLELPDPDQPLIGLSAADWLTSTSDGVNGPPERKGHHRYRRNS